VRPDEAVARLLQAWRGEVEAQAIYTILAQRMREPRRAQVIREIAEGEARHRERIEKRLRELGQPIAWPIQYLRAAPEGAPARLPVDLENLAACFEEQHAVQRQ